MKIVRILKITVGFCLVIFMLIGCTVLNTFPMAARPGDTITLAVGSPDDMKETNTTVEFVPAGGGSVTLPIRSIFKLYPDKRSATAVQYNDASWQLTSTSGHEPWLTVIAIDLPTTGLTPGVGTINITTSATYPTVVEHINNVPIILEILPESAGVGAPHPLEYLIGTGTSATQNGNLNKLEDTHQVLITPLFSGVNAWPTYGAIELTLQFDVDGAPPSEFQIISDDIGLYTGSERNLMYTVTGDKIVVSYISPRGLLGYYEPRFSVVPLPARGLSRNPPLTQPTAEPIVTVRYFDIDGNVVAGPDGATYDVRLQ